jgi:hypothetical protein
VSDTGIFLSATRSAGDQAGVFEHDGATGYFYLYHANEKTNRKVVASIQIFPGSTDLTEREISIRWSSAENAVGLFIRGQLWAAFDLRSGAKYGGNYRPSAQPEIPIEVSETFK